MTAGDNLCAINIRQRRHIEACVIQSICAVSCLRIGQIFRVAVRIHINGHYNITTPRIFYSEHIAVFLVVIPAMCVYHCRCRSFFRGVLRNKKLRAQSMSGNTFKGDRFYLNSTAIGLNDICGYHAHNHQHERNQEHAFCIIP